ncbi:MAG TPA: hypothetical protein VN238_07435, partial [Solirubrobacteraceae bacterium]|nr:hypothetical protein [Solirubrobacteraceae bacterium]
LGREPAEALGAGEGRTAVLEQQLMQHRRLRAQLARELEAVRSREAELGDEMSRLTHERDQLAGELEAVRAASATSREAAESALDDARDRVAYLERRLIELQARGGDAAR